MDTDDTLETRQDAALTRGDGEAAHQLGRAIMAQHLREQYQQRRPLGRIVPAAEKAP